jgi:hypothetical protein
MFRLYTICDAKNLLEYTIKMQLWPSLNPENCDSILNLIHTVNIQ